MIVFDATESTDMTLPEEIIRALPRPLAESLRRLEQETNPQVRLQHLCFSLIPLTFQYFALIFSSEYLMCAAPPDNDVTESLWGMIRRPGPGKWVGFIREAVTYFLKQETQVIPQETIRAFEATLLDARRPRVKYIAPAEEAQQSARRLDYFEALINMRNRFAHSRQIRPERAAEMSADHLLIWMRLILLLRNAFEALRLLIADHTKDRYHSADQRTFEFATLTPAHTRAPLILFHPATAAYLQLFPMVIPFYAEERLTGETLLLEEVKGKYLLYVRQDDYLKRKEEFAALMKLLEARTVPTAHISSEELTGAILGERIDTLTKRTLTAFEDARKYLPPMFVNRPSITTQLDAWMEAAQPGCILVGEPGMGKTSLMAGWCAQCRDRGDHVLLLEAAKLPHTDLPKILETLLNLRSPLHECFNAVYQEMKAAAAQSSARFIIAIDAVNEFVGTGLDNRTVLWRELNSLIDRLDDYHPVFKCLITTRSDLWKADFPRKDSADFTLKRRLYFGAQPEEDGGFPRLRLTALTDQEAAGIYEQARATVAGMSPLTPYQSLPESTRRLMQNPFLLRLVLQTYHDRDVPALTERTLHRQFAREKMLEEQAKRDVLFRLLERMSEFNKTEISLEEFLYGKTRRPKRLTKQDEALQRVLFDPRPASPYKRLVEEGQIEERTVGKGDAQEERIAFCQEKISNLLYVETKRRGLRRSLKLALMILMVFGLLAPTWVGVMQYRLFRAADADLIRDVRELTPEASLTNEQATGLIAQCRILVQAWYSKRWQLLSLFTVILSLPLIGYTFFSSAVALWVVRVARLDLAGRFIRHQFRELTWRYFPFAILPPIAYLLYVAYRAWSLPDVHDQLTRVIQSTPVAAVMGVALIFLLNIWVVLRFAKTPQAAFYMFGPREQLVESLFSGMLILILILLWYVIFPAGNLLEQQLINPKLDALQETLRNSAAYQFLQQQAVATGNPADQELLALCDYIRQQYGDSAVIKELLLDSPIAQQLTHIIWKTVLLLIPVILLLRWLLAYPLEWYLRRKL